jgi:tRNA(Ile)-lysidine synthetase-like protein
MQHLDLPKGKYILAVSGGVDSMVLLDIASGLPDVELIVAHFNHGIREDAADDEEFVVKSVKKHYGHAVVVGEAELGKSASEDLARSKRYEFLYSVAKQNKADKIVTAHHRDDLIETAFINILRGTGPSGLISILSNEEVLRPLIGVTKKTILEYAAVHRLSWREDVSNLDQRYLRNYIRQNIVPNLTESQHTQVLNNIETIANNNAEKIQLIATLSQAVVNNGYINRTKFAVLPTEIAAEVVKHWLKQKNIRTYNKDTIERVIVALKTYKAGSKHMINSSFCVFLENDRAKLTDVQKCLV